MTILIIGGGAAGTFAAIAAKKQSPDANVTLLTNEPCEPYEKPPLSKAVLLGKVSPWDAQIAGPSGVRSHGVNMLCGAHVKSIDRAATAIVLEDGRRLRYDALVVATGAVARELPPLLKGTPRVHYLRTEADAARLKADLYAGRHLLVVGGGLIGLEVAASAAELGMRVTVLELEARVLARVVDEQTGARVHAAHRQHGVDIRLSTSLISAAPLPDGIEATTSGGEHVVADLMVVGIGSVPDTGLASTAGLAVDNGIVVDDQCRTSDPAIYAAGDVVRFPGPRGLVRLENWRHAQDQGMVAGKNAAGASESYNVAPSFWSEQYDLYVQGVGWPTPGTRQVRRALSGSSMLLFELLDGHLVYAMGINAQRDLATTRRLIERKIPVDASELADPARPLSRLLKR